MRRSTHAGFCVRCKLRALLVVVAFCGSGLLAAQQSGFTGRVVVEWVDDSRFVAQMRLVEELSFLQARGKTWRVPAGGRVDGRSMSPLFVRISGSAFDGGFRKSAVIYDYATKDMSQPWFEAQRMFFEASLAEGVPPIEAKVMYLLLYTTGPRWAIQGQSSCFNHCHTSVSELAWRPLIDDEPVVALVSWVRKNDPSLQEIDRRARSAILHPGPHIFGYVR